MRDEFVRGLKHGTPIFLGYLSVSFGVGIMAAHAGFSLWEAILLSLTNLTSAGQAAGIGIIAAGGTMLELVLSQVVINLRYALMSLSLSQKLDASVDTKRRLMISYGITDEIFAVAYSQPRKVAAPYMGGLIFNSAAGWVAGTALGVVAGELLPPAVSGALGIMLYGMFIAIIVPAAKKDRHVLAVISIAIAASLLMHYVFTSVSAGFSIIICALAASVIGALLFPIPEEVSA